jgi:hypothetical protein
MALTSAQKATLKAAITADPVLSALPNNTDGAFEIAAAFNAPATPAFFVWRSLVTEHEFTGTVSAEATSFSWPAYIARSEAERNGWGRMFNGTYSVNPSLPNVRQGIADIFSGSANSAPAQRAHLLAIAKRNATRAEKLFATGTRSTASPATMAFEGSLSYQDVDDARNA